MNLADFDVARIVPSTRDIVLGIATRRRSLTLIPTVNGEGSDDPVADVLRLKEDVRAFATRATGPQLRDVARAASDVPVLSVTPCATPLDCQRARYFGADGVVVASPQGRDEDLGKVARSMRMTPLALAAEAATPDALAALDARAILLTGTLERIRALAEHAPHGVVLVADASCLTLDAEQFASLRGLVDSVLVPPNVFRAEGFAALVERLDT